MVERDKVLRISLASLNWFAVSWSKTFKGESRSLTRSFEPSDFVVSGVPVFDVSYQFINFREIKKGFNTFFLCGGNTRTTDKYLWIKINTAIGAELRAARYSLFSFFLFRLWLSLTPYQNNTREKYYLRRLFGPWMTDSGFRACPSTTRWFMLG